MSRKTKRRQAAVAVEVEVVLDILGNAKTSVPNMDKQTRRLARLVRALRTTLANTQGYHMFDRNALDRINETLLYACPQN